jgi:hypothetical protein
MSANFARLLGLLCTTGSGVGDGSVSDWSCGGTTSATDTGKQDLPRLGIFNFTWPLLVMAAPLTIGNIVFGDGSLAEEADDMVEFARKKN